MPRAVIGARSLMRWCCSLPRVWRAGTELSTSEVVLFVSERSEGDSMSSRSERYLANAEKCQQCADAAYTSGTKNLFGELASQWRRLAEQADGTDEIAVPLLEKIRHHPASITSSAENNSTVMLGSVQQIDIPQP